MKMRRSAFQKRGRTQEVRAALPSGRATLVTDGKRQVTIHITHGSISPETNPEMALVVNQ